MQNVADVMYVVDIYPHLLPVNTSNVTLYTVCFLCNVFQNFDNLLSVSENSAFMEAEAKRPKRRLTEEAKGRKRETD